MSGVQEQLGDNKDIYREIVENVNSIIIRWDTGCRLTFINKYALQFFGYTKEEVLGKCIIGTIVPETSTAGRNLDIMIRDILKYPERYVSNENENMRKNGERVWISWTNKPVLDASGSLTGIITVGNDITALKKAGEELRKARAEVESRIEERTAELRQSEERYRAFYENSIDAILITLPDGRIESANPEACRMFGMSEEEISRAGREGLVDPSDSRLWRLIDERNRAGKAKGELNYRRKDGTVFPGEMSSAVYRNRFGEIRTAIMIRDITERKRTQESLEKYRLISENARDIVLFLRRDGQILEVNEAAVNAYGYSRDELLSMSIYNLRAADPGYKVDEQLDVAFDHGILFETLHRRKAGAVFPVEVSSQGRIVGGQRVLVSVIRDITERKRAEGELAEAKEQAELYVDLMGHDINNLNQSAMGFLELALNLLETENRIGPEDMSLIEMPLKALVNSSKLIDNIRKLQQLMKGGVKTKPVDLCALLKEIDVKSFNFEDRDVTIYSKLSPRCMVEANELLRDVFINLITNAVKHSGRESPLVITVQVETVRRNGQDYYQCIVEDNGPGIPDSLKERLFYRFQRGNTRAHGRGLGLYLVRTLIEGYRGEVWVEDRVRGDSSQGAKFVVLLPAMRE
ncbi:PAS domain S-box protein [Methanocella sp. MCL-LM]|uniref:PAS domain S-box protein n=1 Tax=Methanocella sp. MCL-LM TaxID=3412035 RepID=UPI003C70CE62